MRKTLAIILSAVLLCGSYPAMQIVAANPAAAVNPAVYTDADNAALLSFTASSAPMDSAGGGYAPSNPAAPLSQTYADLMAAVQGETNANAHYLAFAAQARKEGYPQVANLFTATATAEAIHAASEWAMLVTMGATAADKPVADTPVVGTTADNLQAAINGETYEYTEMYLGFAADATAEGNTAAASLFTRTARAEKIHADNYINALNNLGNAAYLNAMYATVYLCPVCGAVFYADTLPSRCTVCGLQQSLYVIYLMSRTRADLMAAVQGETNANAHYLAFAAKAKAEGYPEVANLFSATAAAEAIHAASEWAILVTMGAMAVEKPVAQAFTVGTTAENLQTAINGETYEYTTMYPDFAADATAEGNAAAAALFIRTGKVENIHAENYIDALNNLDDSAYMRATFGTVYLCPVCGATFNVDTVPAASGPCTVCGTAQRLFVQYKVSLTYANLMAAVQGETNANAHYLAFAAKAREEGYYEVANLFTATAAAEAIHAASEWALLVTMGATAAEKPVADTPTVGTTPENLQAAINGETYEYTVMYPGFEADATAEGNAAAAKLFNRTGKVENIHANNYRDALDHLYDEAYMNAVFGTVYLCPVCGATFNVDTVPAASGPCTVCGTAQRLFVQYKVSRTFANLMAAVRGETNANAHYLAFAAKAAEEGYPEIATLFTATAAAEAIHAASEWAMLVTMGATAAEKPVADTPVVGTTAENLLAAINGETYEYTTMYPGFAADATAEGKTDAAALFIRTGTVENIHANNYQDALNNLDNAAYLSAAFGTVYLCPVCGAIFNAATLPAAGRCTVCQTQQSLFVTYIAGQRFAGEIQTYDNLMAAVQGETNANAHYLAFAAQAKAEGYPDVARLFTATAAAEAIHAASEWAMLVTMGATAADKPVADTPAVGTTAENLQAAINGETYEYQTMYPGFAAAATAEGNAAAASLFNRTRRAENVHASNYQDALDNLDNAAYLSATYSTVYLCPVCGAIFNNVTLPTSGRCSVCNLSTGLFVKYAVSRTYADLMAAVQGETNANAHYTAFAAKARSEGYPGVANLFTATAAAEAIHAASEWALLVTMGATAAEKPVADTPAVGTTAENLQAAINGETYEYQTMYPGFAAEATAEGNTVAAKLFNRTAEVENIHANNYTDALNNLYDSAYLKATFSTVYLCPVCGATFDTVTVPSTGRCSVCGTPQSLYVTYAVSQTYADLMAAVQGETNANAHYLAFAAQARKEGYPGVANLFTATATAEAIHAASEWAILVTMGAKAEDKPVAQAFTIDSTAENLLAAISGETYEYTVMYPGFAADATAEGNTVAAKLFNRTAEAESIHAKNYQDALTNLNDSAYLKATFSTVYLCPVCGAVFDAATVPGSGKCTVCGTPQSLYVKFAVSQTYADLMASVQGETNANAHYTAFAAVAEAEGYPGVANLFTATAAAEAIHAASEWALLVTMGATAAEKPVAQDFTAGPTADNLLAAISGETYEYTVMYPGFEADATAEGNTVAAKLFNRTGRVENVHAKNYQDALDNLGNAAYLRATFSTVYLCPVCGATFDVATVPSGSCNVCGTSKNLFVIYTAAVSAVDKSQLDELIALIDGKFAANAFDGYLKTSVAALQSALDAAKAVSMDDAATQEAVDNAYNALYTAYTTGLVKATLTCAVKSMAVKIAKPAAIPYTWDGAGALTFTSSNPAVCGVNGSGVLSPMKAGIAVITIAAPDGTKVVFAVTVTA